VGFHRGYTIYRRRSAYAARLSIADSGLPGGGNHAWLEAPTLEEVRKRIGTQGSAVDPVIALFTRAFAFVSLALKHCMKRAQRSLLAQGGGGSRHSVADLPRRVRFRLAQFGILSRAFADALFHLVPNLRHTRRGAGAPGAATAPRVLVDSRMAEIYLRLLRAAGVIPFVTLERIDDRNQFCRVLGDAERDAPGTRLLVNRDLYCRYHADAAPVRDRLGLVVL
jgi:hypothetical protein